MIRGPLLQHLQQHRRFSPTVSQTALRGAVPEGIATSEPSANGNTPAKAAAIRTLVLVSISTGPSRCRQSTRTSAGAAMVSYLVRVLSVVTLHGATLKAPSFMSMLQNSSATLPRPQIVGGGFSGSFPRWLASSSRGARRVAWQWSLVRLQSRKKCRGPRVHRQRRRGLPEQEAARASDDSHSMLRSPLAGPWVWLQGWPKQLQAAAERSQFRRRLTTRQKTLSWVDLFEAPRWTPETPEPIRILLANPDPHRQLLLTELRQSPHGITQLAEIKEARRCDSNVT